MSAAGSSDLHGARPHSRPGQERAYTAAPHPATLLSHPTKYTTNSSALLRQLVLSVVNEQIAVIVYQYGHYTRPRPALEEKIFSD